MRRSRRGPLGPVVAIDGDADAAENDDDPTFAVHGNLVGVLTVRGLLWHGIKTAAAPRVAAQQAAESQPKAAPQTVLLQGFKSVLRAGGQETAARAGKQMDQRRKEALIAANQKA